METFVCSSTARTVNTLLGPPPNGTDNPGKVLIGSCISNTPCPLTRTSVALCLTGSNSVKVMDAQSLQVVQDLALKDVLEIDFSPKGTFLSTWQRQSMLWPWIMMRGEENGFVTIYKFMRSCKEELDPRTHNHCAGAFPPR